MTAKDKELQELRRKVKDLETIHQLDLSEIMLLRRRIEVMEEQLERRNRK